jgi:hypothetical protein
LLKLTPRGGLEIQQYLNQISLRRFGEIACVVEGDFYLFLFACRADSLEPALGNICRLAWRDLFSALQILTGVDELSRAAFLDAVALPAAFHLADGPVAGDSTAVAEHGAYVPQRSSLLISEVCP